jgi:hypothetical protein
MAQRLMELVSPMVQAQACAINHTERDIHTVSNTQATLGSPRARGHSARWKFSERTEPEKAQECSSRN